MDTNTILSRQLETFDGFMLNKIATFAANQSKAIIDANLCD